MPPLLTRRQSPPPIQDDITMSSSIPETVLLETSYEEEFGSRQTEISKLPFPLTEFPLLSSGVISTPPLLDESDTDSSFESLEFSSGLLSKIHDTAEADIEVFVDDGDSFYTGIMEQPHSSSSSLTSFSKHVRFSTVEIREYKLCIGNHPNCSASGLPISLDWEYSPTTTIIDLQETTLVHETPQRRPAQRLTLLQRMKRLKPFYKSEELWIAERERRLEWEEEEFSSSLQRVPTIDSSLCGEACTCEEEQDDYFGSIVEERQLAQQTAANLVCDAMQCIVSL